MAQIPTGSPDLICPFHKETMDKVCHKCPLWVQVRGANPQDGQPLFDEWQCSFTWMPLLMTGNIQQGRQAGASMDKVANEVRAFHENMAQANMVNLAMLADGKDINGSDSIRHRLNKPKPAGELPG